MFDIAAAEEALRAGEFGALERTCKTTLITDPSNSPAHTFMAEIHMRRGDFAAATAHADKALSSPNAYVNAFLVRAELALFQDDRPMAVELCKIIVEHPQATRAGLVLSTKLLTTDNGLLKALERLSSEAGGDFKYWAERSRSLLNEKKYEEALAAADEALERKPDNPTALQLAANCARLLRNEERLIDSVRRVAKIDPNIALSFIQAILNRGREPEAGAIIADIYGLAKEETDALAEAKATVVAALTKRINDSQVNGDTAGDLAATAVRAKLTGQDHAKAIATKSGRCLQSGKAALDAGDLPEAEKQLSAAATFGSSPHRAHKFLAMVREQQNDWSAATEHWLHTLDGEGLKVDEIRQAMRRAARAGEKSGANAAVLESFVRHAPLGDAEAQALVEAAARRVARDINAALEQGQVVACAEPIRSLASVNTDQARRHVVKWARQATAQLRQMKEDRDDETGIELGQAVLAIEPDNATALRLTGILLMRKRRFEEALPLISRLVEKNPPTAANLNALGRALAGLGRQTEARQAFQAALSIDPQNQTARRALTA